MSITAAQIQAAAGPQLNSLEAEAAQEAVDAANHKAWQIANPELALGEKIDRRLTVHSQKEVAAELRIEVSIVRKRKALTRAFHRAGGRYTAGAEDALNAAWIEAVESPLAALCRAAQ